MTWYSGPFQGMVLGTKVDKMDEKSNKRGFFSNFNLLGVTRGATAGKGSRNALRSKASESALESGGESRVRILKKGAAARVIFFYPGEEGTYVDGAEVTLYENGIIHIKSNQEETTTHLQNCEILWRFETDAAEDRTTKVRLLKPKSEAGHSAKLEKASEEASNVPSDGDGPNNNDKPPRLPHGSKKNPELR
jgi:hypothetical protein